MHKDAEAEAIGSEDVASRLERQPIIRARITKLPDLIENAGGDKRNNEVDARGSIQ
ncbi:MAG: hypothetical protein Q8O25_15035 [Sulfurisoma sp.]|nr:hypothetical protein [Sulfurisoma sp.]